MNQFRILSLDDKDFITQTAIGKNLSNKWSIDLVSTYEESLNALKKNHYDVLLLDNDLGPNSPTGIQLVPTYLKEFSHLAIIILTHHDELQEVNQAFIGGAEDYIVKSSSLSSICEELFLKIPECINRARRRRVLEYQSSGGELEGPLTLKGTSNIIKALRETISLQQIKDSPLLLIGESGSGRSSLAKYFWEQKKDLSRPFITFKVSKIPKSRIKADLFGGATGDQSALFMSNHGDLLISDFDFLPKNLQAKIVGFAAKSVIKVKKSKVSIEVQNRLLLTSTEIPVLIRKSRLFKYIRIPPLRERTEDIEVIASGYLNRYKLKKYFLSDKARHFMMKQRWPGNLRQLTLLLDSVISDLISNKRERIDIADLIRAERKNLLNIGSLEIPLPQDKTEINSSIFKKNLATFERALIAHALSLYDGNIRATSSALGIPRSTFYRRLQELNIL